jgi:adenylate cyclase
MSIKMQALPKRLRKFIWQSIWPWRGVLIAAPTASVVILGLRSVGLLQGLELALLDQLFRSKPVLHDRRIVIVEIQESDLQKYLHPIADDTLAALLTKISAQKPQSIGLDLYRDLPVRSGYPALAKVFKTTPNLIGIRKLGGTTDRQSIAPPPVLAQQDQIAINDMVVDGDGRLRRGLLFLADKENNNLPTLSMTLASSYLESAGIEPEMADETTVKLGTASIKLFGPNEGGYVRADANGYQILLNHRIAADSFSHYSLDQVLQGQVPANWATDRIVLIGPTAESLNDFFYTSSSDQGFFQPLWRIPGVYLHAQLTSQLLSTALNHRSAMLTLSDTAESGLIVAGAILGALLVWHWRYGIGDQKLRNSRWQLVLPIVGIGGIASGLGALGLGAFWLNWWLPIVPTIMSLTSSSVLVTMYQAQKMTELRKTLGRYLTHDVVANLLESPEGITINGESRKVTTLISDIRGFTSLSEQYSAAKIVEMLNLYLTIMTRTIQSYGGTINDLTGDGMIVFFGAPLGRSDDTMRAVACALAMQQAMTEVNQQNATLGFPQLEMGIGLNTGEVVVGNIGSDAYMKYTAIGSHVNLAARVESCTVGGQVLISEQTFADVESIVQIIGETQAQMKGVAKPVTLYDVKGITGDYNIVLVDAVETSTVLKQSIPVTYNILEGKHLNDECLVGNIVSLSVKGAKIRSNQILKPLTNLKLTIGTETEIYAKVLRPDPDGGFWVQFTMIPANVEAILKAAM